MAETDVTVTTEPGPCSSLGSLCERLYDWTGSETLAETTVWVVGTPVKIAVVVALAVVANRVARRAIRRATERVGETKIPGALVSQQGAERTEQRARSIGALARSAASALIFSTATIVVLDILGVSVVPIMASLGIAGIALGFGAQTLVEDLISGLMLVVEDQFGVGDRVDVGVVEGQVVRLTLRSTVILDATGVQWFVPNSEIRRVANESQHKTQARVRVGVSYDTDLRQAFAVLRHAAEELIAEERWQQAGVEPVAEPFAAELGDHAIEIEIRTFIEPQQRRPLERALRVRLVEAAREAGIELPNLQLDVWQRSSQPSPSVGEQGADRRSQ